MNDYSIMKELVWLSAKNPKGSLLPFKSLVGAYQYRRLYRVFRKYAPSGVEVLDWSVGNGHFSYFLVHAGYKTFGYSLEKPPVGLKLSNTKYTFVQGECKSPNKFAFE